MTEYTVIKPLSDGLLVLHSEFGDQIFSSRRARRRSVCKDCRLPISVGQLCWGQLVSTAMNRSHRICDTCVSRLLNHWLLLQNPGGSST